MKAKKIIPLIAALSIFSGMLWAQNWELQKKFIATTEEEVFSILDQMIDSMLLSISYVDPDIKKQEFALGYFSEISSRDTIMKIEQDFHWVPGEGYVFERFYCSYLSDCQPVAFYRRLLDYFKHFKNIDPGGNYFLKKGSVNQLFPIIKILIKRYESGELSEADKTEAFRLIELATLRMINDAHRNAIFLKGYEKYVTDTIRQAVINVIENPFYPAEYVDFYVSIHIKDTISVVDTVGIAETTKEKIIKGGLRLITLTAEEVENDYPRYSKYLYYKKLGEEWGGLSPGEAYLEEKRRKFPYKGYVGINTIAEYAYRVQDTLLIEHLMKFKEKHPDYPLKYF